MTGTKNWYEDCYGASPDDDSKYIELDDCVTFEEFDLFDTEELSELLEELRDSKNSYDKDKAETIVDVLRKRGCDIKPNKISGCVHDWEFAQYYTLDEIEKYKSRIELDIWACEQCLTAYRKEGIAFAIKRTEEMIAKLNQKITALKNAIAIKEAA